MSASAPPPSPSSALHRLVAKEDLSEPEAMALANELIEGSVPPERVGALLAALAAKGETVDELVGFARAMRARSRSFPGPSEAGAVDLCGTGGAPTPSYNISTVSAFVVAACGLPVAKHGNVSARGPCGSSDLLEALGLPVTRSVRFAEVCWKEERLAFLHAPLYHPATKAVGPARKALGIRTIFNQLGPLTNPAGVRVQLVGAYSKEYAKRAGSALRRLGVERSMLVHGSGGLDELSSLGPSWAWRFVGQEGGELRVEPKESLRPEERKGDLGPRPPAVAAQEAKEVLLGQGDGAVRGAVLLTAGAALWTAERAADLTAGVDRARHALEAGAAFRKLKALKAIADRGGWEA